MMKYRTTMLAALLPVLGVASAQTARQREELSIEGYPGKRDGHAIPGACLRGSEELARITHGSLNFAGNRICRPELTVLLMLGIR
jgi:hypothetical protein